MNLSEMQKAIYQNKIDHNFNVTNIEKEFLALYGEVGEAFDAYRKKEEVGEELADVAIYLLGIAEILSIDLDTEIQKKMKINQARRYVSYGNGYAKRIDE
jgi:NTP pyrophosphatase (non-canonical NTP hydrolase)